MLMIISRIIVWACFATIVITPVIYLYFAFHLDVLQDLVVSALTLPVKWSTVGTGQWYTFLGLTFAYHCLGLISLYMLGKAFQNFANGMLFEPRNSQYLRRFSQFIFVQALLAPVHFALSSVILSMNHPVGQKMLSIQFGSNEVKVILLAGVMWVISELIIKAGALETENKQFV